ncbi:MAG: hypothetical protein CMI02_06815 [Oceanospirillaceae bacterium]|nr:hypothetical protein [Oceanospirillaceae bacterium]MBT11728.1 hypothetical protein [Oceanospirillaceae bacterium]|tara:strand:+ start:28101 stop:28661 length:561 start_codon:yes stop_codon:yes gene_type:complete
MVKALVGIADGSEDIEAVSIIDTLRRGGVEVTVASVMDSQQITCANGTKITADAMISDCDGQQWDAVIAPGGMPGAEHLSDNAVFTGLMKKQLADNKVAAAICASPAVVMAKHGMLDGKKATCYPGFEELLLESATMALTEAVVVDENIVTSRGPATAVTFALVLVGKLCGPEKSREVGQGMLATA